MSDAFRCGECSDAFDTKTGLSLHETQTHDDPKPWHDEERLRELYIEEGYLQREIAEMLGADQTTISKYLLKFGVETRATQNRPPHFHTNCHGYENWRHSIDGEVKTVTVHRLIAVAEHGFDAVADNHVHHKNEIKWDNRPENLEPIDPFEHLSQHHEEGLWDDHLESVHEQMRGSKVSDD